MGAIYLWWIGAGEVEERVMEEVQAKVEQIFGLPAQIWRGPERPKDTLDAVRGQHSSTGILRWLVAHQPREAEKILGLTDVDLFIPVLTFVFGEAQLNGSAAVVSTARLATNPSGRTAEPRVLASRLVRECVHELGHTFGLIHCADSRCVMARSASLPHVDAKRDTLCEVCLVRFQERPGRGGARDG